MTGIVGYDPGKSANFKASSNSIPAEVYAATQEITGDGAKKPKYGSERNGEDSAASLQKELKEGEEGYLLNKADMFKLGSCSLVPARVDRCMHELIAEYCHAQPNAPAVCAWDGNFTYNELDRLSSAVAVHLASCGVGPEMFVPLCFEKSCWTVMALLGVLKAGAAFVLLDPSQPVAATRDVR